MTPLYKEESVIKAMREGRCGSLYEGHFPATLEVMHSTQGGWEQPLYLGFLCRKCKCLVFVDSQDVEYVNPAPTPRYP